MTSGALDLASPTLPLAAGPELSVIVPVKDEDTAIGPLLHRLVPLLDALYPDAADNWELLFVDDGSTDRTLDCIEKAVAADPRVRAISLSRNFGKEAALSAGLDYIRGRAVVPLDVDLQDPPEAIGDMLARWREGYEVVYGVRRNRKSDSWSKRISADLYYRIHNLLSPNRIPEHAGDFRLLDRVVVDVIRQMPERNRFMKGLFAWGGFRQTAIEYDRASRTTGKSKFHPWKLWTLALDGITSASTVPLRVWSYIGLVVALLSFFYMLFLIGRTMIFGTDVAGYASLMVAVLFFGGLQLISLGVLGEYVGRTLIETKQRPLYIVRRKLGFSTDEGQR